jgi:hypothetical protein
MVRGRFKNFGYSITPINRTLVIRIANYPDRLRPSGNFVENSTKLIFLEISGNRIEYSTVKLCGCLELQIRRGRKVWTEVRTVNNIFFHFKLPM